MTPAYSIDLGGQNITGNFTGRMLSVTVVEKAGNNEFSTVDIELDDRDCAIAVPPKGQQLTVSLGFLETGIGQVGTFTINEVQLVWEPARKMTLKGRSADLKNTGLKASQNQNYQNPTLASIAGAVAGRSGLELVMQGNIGQNSLGAMLHQSNESDMHLLNRLARDNNAVFTVNGNKLIIAPQGTPLAGMTVTVTPALISKCHVKLPDDSEFSTATAFAHDFTTGKRLAFDGSGSGGGGSSTVGAGSLNLKHLFWDTSVAMQAARARKSELDRRKAEAHCELALGNPNIGASGNLVLSGFRPGMDGTYTITQVEHNYDSSGYVTKIDGENQEDSGPEAEGTGNGDNEE